jgi:hypothetical protein
MRVFLNIVDVGWGGSGAVFVVVILLFQRYVKIPRWDSDQDSVGLTSVAFGDGGGTFGSSYGFVNGTTPHFA